MSLPDLILQRLDGTELPLSTLQGQVVLVVNVASRCGFTPSPAISSAIRSRGMQRR